MGPGITGVAVKKVLKSELGMTKTVVSSVLAVASALAVSGCEKKEGTPFRAESHSVAQLGDHVSPPSAPAT